LREATPERTITALIGIDAYDGMGGEALVWRRTIAAS
jgi:hypothetical protein